MSFEGEKWRHSVLRLPDSVHQRLKEDSVRRRIPMKDAILRAVLNYLEMASAQEGADVPKRYRPHLNRFTELLVSRDDEAIDSVVGPIEYAHRHMKREQGRERPV
jgi:hypothetical protein